MKIVYMGTPDFAVTILDRLIAAGHEIDLVFTQPDRPKGRGKKLQAPPVAEYAKEHG
ncbi:MAG: methionyl-tRNA formyltransferase, partial [Peptococcaceae bacterium]|nr:methionyl-tRNA formyltransferase [Peptococcaceae bacterium]